MNANESRKNANADCLKMQKTFRKLKCIPSESAEEGKREDCARSPTPSALAAENDPKHFFARKMIVRITRNDKLFIQRLFIQFVCWRSVWAPPLHSERIGAVEMDRKQRHSARGDKKLRKIR